MTLQVNGSVLVGNNCFINSNGFAVTISTLNFGGIELGDNYTGSVSFVSQQNFQVGNNASMTGNIASKSDLQVGNNSTITGNLSSGSNNLQIGNGTIVNGACTPSNAHCTGTVSSCSPPSNIPAGVTVSCQCDNFKRATLNPSTIFNSNWIVSTSDATGILPSIVNSGYLRLTNNTGNNAKAATVPGIFPAAGNYISVEFNHYAYNGSGADGLAVILSDYAVPAVPGAFGGSLGYAQRTGVVGFAGGWLGVALDEYGNYQNPTEGRIGGAGFISQSVGMRGSGSGMNGYNYLAGTASLNPQVDNRTSTTPSRGFYYQVIVDARNDPTSTSVSVNRDTTGTGNSYTSLITIPNVYTAATAKGFTQSAVPTNWQISFTGSTGGATNIHEIGGLRICASTMVPPSGGTAGGFNAIDSAYGKPPLAVQNYLNGHIYTKLVGTPFNLNVAALSNNQIVTTYAASGSKTVTVKLVDNSDSLANSALDCTLSCTSTCTSKVAITGGTQSLTFASGATDKGQKQSPSFTVNSAYQKLVAIISDGSTSACSTDSFSIRPLSIASVTSSNATNTSSIGTPIFKAGSDNFALTTTTTGVSGSPSGYTGVMKINNSLLTAASPATVAGTLAGTFPAATSAISSSSATGTTFTYSEVGGFTLPVNSVYEGVVSTVDCNGMTPAQCDSVKSPTWTGVDSISSKGDCIADSFSNTIAGGKYGCNFGLATANTFGRFVPDHFDTAVTLTGGVPMPCPTGLTCPILYYGFVYSGPIAGQPGQPITLNVYARNALGNLTQNYDNTTGLSKTVSLSAWSALGGATAISNGTLNSNTVPASAFKGGATTLGIPATPNFTFTTTPTAPMDIYIRAVDTDNVTSLRALSVEGGVKVVSGRVNVTNAYGSELLALTLTASTQYWSGITYVTSTTDTVNVVTAGKVSRTNCQGMLLSGGSCSATLGAISSVVSATPGVYSINLGAPGNGNTGSEYLSVNAGGWPTWLPSKPGRATFGVYKGANQFIYMREMY